MSLSDTPTEEESAAHRRCNNHYNATGEIDAKLFNAWRDLVAERLGRKNWFRLSEDE